MNKIFSPHHWRIYEASPDITRNTDPRRAQSSLIKWKTLKQRQPVKRNELYFTHTSGVGSRESLAILTGIEKIVQELRSRIQIKNFGAMNLGDEPFGSTDWYQNQATLIRQRGLGQQIRSSTLLDLLPQEPYQQHPHMDVMAFDRDMTTGEADNNFVFGASRYPHFVMSVRRLRDRIKDTDLRELAIAIISAHETAHNFGLVGRNFNWVNKLGPHCNGESGPCLMEQVDVPGSRTIEDQTLVIVEQSRWLCNDCFEEADFKKNNLEERGILW